jgi:putative endonuclease
MDKKEFGTRGESIAKQYLANRGYIILEENWRFQHLELDLIVADDEHVVFVEVKTRKASSFETIEDMITKKKQRFLIIAANAYIEKNEITKEARFDVISITFENEKYEVEHIVDAFYPEV